MMHDAAMVGTSMVYPSSSVGSPANLDVLDVNTGLHLVWRHMRRCTNAVRTDLMVCMTVLVVVSVSMSFPWVT